MAINDFSKESAENFEQKWFCLFLIDVSASMSDEILEKVNMELRNLHRLVKEDVASSQRFELCLLTVGQDSKTIQEPALVTNFTMPTIIREDGTIRAIKSAAETINARIRWYKETGQPFYRPCLFLITNNANEKMLQLDELIPVKREVQNNKYDFIIVGMNRSSFYAHSSNEEIRLKDNRSLAQILYSAWNKVSFDPEAPYDSSTVTDDVLTGWITSFEI